MKSNDINALETKLVSLECEHNDLLAHLDEVEEEIGQIRRQLAELKGESK